MVRDEELIEAVRDYPCLYNSKSADFKVLLKKENALTLVAARLQRTGEQCTCIRRAIVVSAFYFVSQLSFDFSFLVEAIEAVFDVLQPFCPLSRQLEGFNGRFQY